MNDLQFGLSGLRWGMLLLALGNFAQYLYHIAALAADAAKKTSQATPSLVPTRPS